MMRLLVACAVIAIGLPGFCEEPARGFRTEPDEGSRAAMAEYQGVRLLQFQQEIFSRDDNLSQPLLFALPLDPDSYRPSFDADGKPTPYLAVLMRHSGKSSGEVAKLLKLEKQRYEELQRLSSRIRDLRATIDLRAGEATRAVIDDCLARAERLREEQAKLTIEMQKFRASREMYANFAALQSKANLTEAERGDLAGLNRLLANLTLEDAVDYRNYMTRLMQSRASLKAGKGCQRLFLKSKPDFFGSRCRA